MRKVKQFVLALALAASAGAHAQEAPDFVNVKGQSFLNVGVGVGTFGLTGAGGLPITASFEHGVTDKISAGLTAGYVKTRFYTNYHYTYYMVGARGSYHFNELLNVGDEKLDVYGGLAFFYRGYKADYKDQFNDQYAKARGGAVAFALHAGARYMFAGNIGGYAELGYGISPLQLGVTVKF